MSDTFRGILEFIMYASGISLILIFSMDAITYFYKKSAMYRNYKQAEEMKKVRAVINNALCEINTLPPDEQALLKYVYDTQRSAVYIPGTGACLSLLKKGYLRLMLNMVCKRWTSYKEPPCLCYFCELPAFLRNFLQKYYNAIDWKNSPAPDYDKYQES